MRVGWSRDAGRDRDSIFAFIAADNLSAATANDHKIAAIEARLAQYAHSGRRGRLRGTRELVITGTPFIAVYRVGDDEITILRVLHGAQQWPPRRKS